MYTSYKISGWRLLIKYSSSFLLFGKASTPGQSQNKLGPKVYSLLHQAAVLPKSNAGNELSQHQILSSKTVRPCAPCGVLCMDHAIKTGSEVCSGAPHSQFVERTRSHLCMDKRNCPISVCCQLSLTQAVWSKLIPTGLDLILGMKTRSLDILLQYCVFHL